MTLVTQHIDTLTTELMRLNFIAQEVNSGLSSQARLLQVRSLELPKGVLAEVEVLKDMLQQLAGQVEEEQLELAQLRALSSTAALINSSLDWDQVIAKAMDLVIGLTGAERGYILMENDRSKRFEVIVARNIDRKAIQEQDFAFSRSIVEEVVTQGIPIVTDNAQQDSQIRKSDSILRYDMRSILCVPLQYHGEVSGVIYVDNTLQQGSFGDKEKRLLMAFANQAAIAIQNARLFDQVRRQIDEVNAMRQFLDRVFASIGSGIITTYRDGLVRTINPAATNILGTPAENSLNRPVLEILPPLYEGFELVLGQVLDEGKIEIIEVSTVLPSGPAYLSLKISPLKDQQESIIGIAIVVDDLTEIKRREETINVIRTYLPPALINQITSFDSLLGGEERIVSVVFADVRGFTTFSEKLEPEILMQVINQYLTIGADAINDYNGIIDKYMGDAIVGLFNTQINSHGDHALRAVRTAWQTVQNVIAFNSNLPPDDRLSYGVGVHTDLAVLGNIGSPNRKEFTALGNALTYAKKLQEIARPNEVIISNETYEIVRDLVEAEPIERETRTGDNVLRAYLVLGCN